MGDVNKRNESRVPPCRVGAQAHESRPPEVCTGRATSAVRSRRSQEERKWPFASASPSVGVFSRARIAEGLENGRSFGSVRLLRGRLVAMQSACPVDHIRQTISLVIVHWKEILFSQMLARRSARNQCKFNQNFMRDKNSVCIKRQARLTRETDMPWKMSSSSLVKRIRIQLDDPIGSIILDVPDAPDSGMPSATNSCRLASRAISPVGDRVAQNHQSTRSAK